MFVAANAIYWGVKWQEQEIEYSELLKWASEPETKGNGNFIDNWYSSLESKNEKLDKLAIFLAKLFICKEVDLKL